MSTLTASTRPLHAESRSDILDPFKVDGSDIVAKPLDGGTHAKSFDVDSLWGGAGQSYRYMMRLAGDTQMTKPYLQSPWIYACVNKRAEAVASMPLRFRDRARKVVDSGALIDLFAEPNPLMSQKEFWFAHIVNMDLFGECFWVLLKKTVSDRNGARVGPIAKGELPDEIWPIRGDMVSPVMDEITKLPAAWTIGGIDYPAHAVVQFAMRDPYNPLRGIGPVQAAMRTAYKDFQADRYDEALLRNGGSPGGVLSLQGTLNAEQRRALAKAWHDAVETPEQHRKTAVLELGTTFTQYGFSPQEMEFKDLRAWSRDIYMAIFGVTRALLALTEGLNYASATEAKKIFWHGTIKPLGDMNADRVTLKFLRKLTGAGKDWTAYFDASDVEELQATKDAKIDRFMKLHQQCGFSKNEAARIAELEIGEVQDGDRLFIPASMQPLPEEAAQYAKPAPVAKTNGHVVEPPNRIAALLKTLPSEDARELAWRRMEERLLPLDHMLAAKVERPMRDMVLATRARIREAAASAKTLGDVTEKIILTEAAVEELVQINTQKWIAELESKVDLPFGATWDAGVNSLLQENVAALMRHTDPLALQFLSAKKIQLAEGAMTTLAEQVRLTIMKTLATSGLNSVAEAIAEKLRELESEMKVLLDSIEARALRIARTENTAIYNGSRTENMLLAGVDQHMWLSARDAHVRHDHQTLDGAIARVGHSFGFNLRFPGDPQAGAKQVVGCRCTTIPVQDEQT